MFQPSIQDRIFFALDRIFFVDDRIFSAKDRIFLARTVYFSLGPYILPGPYIFKDRIFYFSGPYILLYNLPGKIKKPTNWYLKSFSVAKFWMSKHWRIIWMWLCHRICCYRWRYSRMCWHQRMLYGNWSVWYGKITLVKYSLIYKLYSGNLIFNLSQILSVKTLLDRINVLACLDMFTMAPQC